MKRRRNNFKFTEKSNSKKGMLSCVLSATCMISMIFMIGDSFTKKGNSTVYFGSAGLLALIVSVVSIVIACKSLREENSFKTFPVAALLLSLFSTGAWTALYVTGFLI